MTFDEQNLEKKFLSVTNSQDSIQTLSLWILHHKNHYKKIIKMWLKMLEKEKSTYRLTLFYLANDVIQHAKKKNLNQYLDGFQDVLKRATVFVKDGKIVSKISRVFSIWLERNIYPPEFINELKEILQSTQSNVQDETTMKIVSEFKLLDLEIKLKKVQKAVATTQNLINNINITKIDSLNNDLLSHLKDKSSGEQYCKEFDEIEKVLQNAIVAIESEISSRASFLTLLENAEIYYETQKLEVKIVANAYKNFSVRVNAVKNKLSDSTYPSPHPSPLIDAPSPTISDDGLILPGNNSPLPGLKTLLDVLPENSSKKNKISSLDKRLSNLMQNIPSSIIQKNNSLANEPSHLHSNTSLLDGFTNKTNLDINNANPKIDSNWSTTNNDYANQQQIFAYQNLMNIPENNFYSGYPPPPPPPPIEDYYQNHNKISLNSQDQNLNENNSFKDNTCVQQIKSVISTRNNDELNLNNKSSINFDPFINHSNFNLLNHHSTHENFEPSDMDLDNSDEEDNMNRSQNSQRVLKVIETVNNTNGNISNKQIKSQIHHTIQPSLHHNLNSISQVVPSIINLQGSNNNNYHNGKQKQFYSPGKSFHYENRNSRWSNNHSISNNSNSNNQQSKSHLQSSAIASTSHKASSSFGNGPNRLLQQNPHNINNSNNNTNSNNNITRSWKTNQIRLNNNNARNRGSFSNYHY